MKNIRKFHFVSLLVLTYGICKGSTDRSQVDSLKNLLQATNDISVRIEIYTQLAKSYQRIDPDSALHYALTALPLTDSKTPKNILGEIHGCIGDVAVMQDSLDKATDAYLNSASYFEEGKLWDKLIPVYLVLGNILVVKDKLVEALTYYHKGIEIAQKNGLESRLPSFYMNIGTIHFKSRSYTEALRYFTLALDGSEKNNDSSDIAMSMSNIGTVYAALNDFNLSENYFQKTLKLYHQLSNRSGLAEAYLSLGGVLEKKNEYSGALNYFRMCIDELDSIGYQYAGPKESILAEAYIKMGRIYVMQHEPAKAMDLLRTGFGLAKKNNLISLLAEGCEVLSLLWEERSKPDSALFYSRLYNQYYNQQLNEQNIRNLSFQAAQFEFEQQARTAELERARSDAKKKRNYLILSIVIGLLLAVCLLLYFLFRLGKNKLIRSDLERKNLENELEFRNKELTTHVMYQVRNKEFLLKISEKLKNGTLMENPSYRSLVKEVILEMEKDSNIDTWKEFEIRFQRVHSDFYKKLSASFPDLSPNELKICAFLKLNMATKDIASITYQTPNSIDVARHRLRQKFNLGKEENLVSFLSQF